MCEDECEQPTVSLGGRTWSSKMYSDMAASVHRLLICTAHAQMVHQERRSVRALLSESSLPLLLPPPARAPPLALTIVEVPLTIVEVPLTDARALSLARTLSLSRSPALSLARSLARSRSALSGCLCLSVSVALRSLTTVRCVRASQKRWYASWLRYVSKKVTQSV